MPIVDLANYSVPSMLGQETNLLGNFIGLGQAQGGLIWNDTSPTASTQYTWPTYITSASNNIFYYPTYQYGGTGSVTTPINYYYQVQAPTNDTGWLGAQVYFNYGGNWAAEPYVETEEAKAVREAQEQKRVVAATRAEELLLLHLSDDEQKQYLEKGYFETKVNDKIYRINKGRAGNVYLIEEGKTKYKYCAHPSAYTPEQDAMLAQLLMLKTDEERFLKTANRTVLG